MQILRRTVQPFLQRVEQKCYINNHWIPCHHLLVQICQTRPTNIHHVGITRTLSSKLRERCRRNPVHVSFWLQIINRPHKPRIIILTLWHHLGILMQIHVSQITLILQGHQHRRCLTTIVNLLPILTMIWYVQNLPGRRFFLLLLPPQLLRPALCLQRPLPRLSRLLLALHQHFIHLCQGFVITFG